jgi:hypothetical protein
MKYYSVIVLLFFVFSVVDAASKYNEPKKYYTLCREIDCVDARNLRNTIMQIRSANHNAPFVGLKHELDLSRQHVEEKRERALQDFKNYYDINSDIWRWMRSTMTQIHIWKDKNKTKFFIDTRSDKNVPESAVVLLHKELIKRKVNPSRVDLLSTIADPFLYGVKVFRRKSEIAINPKRWDQESLERKQFMSICAVEELVEELSLMRLLLKNWWDRIIPLNKQHDAIGFTRFREMIKIVSMYSACLRDRETAILMKKYAHCIYNPSFTSADYAFISAVEWHWQVLDKAQRYPSVHVWIPEQKVDKKINFSLASSSDSESDSTVMTSESEDSVNESGSEEQGADEADEYTDFIN